MNPRRSAATVIAAALPMLALAPRADALTIQQVTRHGYIVVDEPNAAIPYNGSAGASSTLDFSSFLSDLSATLDAAGAPHADFIAVMQSQYDQSVVAFYLRVRNQTRGVGDTNPQGGLGETYDLNNALGLSFPVDGALFLNSPGFYTNPGVSNYGTQIICPQEFGHRFLAQIHVPPYPAASMPDAGDDASVDASDDLATSDATDDAMPADDADADTDATDATDDVMPYDAGPPNAVDIMLGRDLSHWSYFMNTGGSPVEGNAWEEIMPGVFRTMPTSIQFSPLDLYLMGLEPSSFVQPFWVIADPDVMGQYDQFGNVINRASPPEDFGDISRVVEIRGRRVTYAIDDVIRANGPRVPAYFDPDAGQGPADDAGTEYVLREMRVIWVLLSTSDQVHSDTGSRFDNAIEACSMGYSNATGGRAMLVPIVMPQPDAGPDGAVDGATDAVADAVTTDADGGSDASRFANEHAVGGCGCHAVGGRATGAWGAMLALAGLFGVRRRRKARRG